MKVSLIDYTGKGTEDPWYAAALMIWTKRTRVEMSPGGFEEIRCWPEAKLREELLYMSATVPSSWEFCDYTFLLQGVTRAFTHQLVRTRTASYAQQNQSVQNVSGWKYEVGPSLRDKEDARDVYETLMLEIARVYDYLVSVPGVKVEDARGCLPTNVHTNIVVKANLRTLTDMLKSRESPRNQGEFVEVLRAMKAEMISAHPWVSIFVDRNSSVVARELYDLIQELPPSVLRTDIIKRVDQLLTHV